MTFTDEQKSRILSAAFEIKEIMDEMDAHGMVLLKDGPGFHPRFDDLEHSVEFILSDFDDDDAEEIVGIVNDLRGIDVEGCELNGEERFDGRGEGEEKTETRSEETQEEGAEGIEF